MTTTPTTDQLCNGFEIGYKAYKRRVNPSEPAGGIVLLAVCQLPTAGWSIYFTAADDKYELWQKQPTHPVPQLVTFFSACFNSGYELGTPPATVTITDGLGTHKIPVEDWPV